MKLPLPAVCLAVIALSGCGNLWANDKPLAPPFAGLSSDGEYYSMLDITRTKDLVVVFIHPECPIGLDALSALQNIQEAVGSSRLSVLGVVSVPVSQFDQWNGRAAPPIPAIADADRRFATAYRAEISPTFQLIRKRGELSRSWQGLSTTTTEEIAKEIDPKFTGDIGFTPKSTQSLGRPLLK